MAGCLWRTARVGQVWSRPAALLEQGAPRDGLVEAGWADRSSSAGAPWPRSAPENSPPPTHHRERVAEIFARLAHDLSCLCHRSVTELQQLSTQPALRPKQQLVWLHPGQDSRSEKCAKSLKGRTSHSRAPSQSHPRSTARTLTRLGGTQPRGSHPPSTARTMSSTCPPPTSPTRRNPKPTGALRLSSSTATRARPRRRSAGLAR